ncbi:MAG TPA: DUF3488 domain-containing protein [Sedimenticola sp.]|nr:DUF3488 domain-containing protein [Sedimenticola sp.]
MTGMTETTLRRRELLPVTLLTLLAAAPHLQHLPATLGAFFVAITGLRLLALMRPTLLPGRLLLLPLTFGGLALVLVEYPVLFGREAGVALLVSMLGLKLLEIRRRRDLFVLAFIGYFTLGTLFLFSQSAVTLVYALLLTLGFTATLVEGSRLRPSPSLLLPLKQAALLLLQSLPLAMVLFLLFPRFDSPLWELGAEEQQGVTGFTDRLTPGAVSRLSRSRRVAFRVTFDGPLPQRRLRYWRGLVLWHTDGRVWTRGSLPGGRLARLQAQGDPVGYQVTLEPTGQRWLFALELPFTAPAGTRLDPAFQLIRGTPVSHRLRYRVRSYLRYRTGPLGPEERRLALQLPDNVTRRMRALVRAWRENSADDAALVRHGLAWLHDQPFYYTLYPPPVDANPADQFLFETRRGFCEHYATSFTLLMRLAGIPARVVAGYQGGEFNPLGAYLIVRQSDAHAWSEVWLQGQGWVRVDPTAAVAPGRIEQALDPGRVTRETGAPIDFTPLQPGYLGPLLQRLAWGADAVNEAWHRWVLGYSGKRQSQLLERLGLGFLNGVRLAFGMVSAALLTLLLISGVILYRARGRPEPAQRAYRRFCQRLARKGLERRPSEGPVNFARRVIRARPDLGRQVAAITALYIDLRYGTGSDLTQLARLRRLVARFRP